MDKRLKQLLTDIRELYSDAKIYLFGSRAKGTAHEYSDFDLIIISEKFGKTDFVDRGEPSGDIPMHPLEPTCSVAHRMSSHGFRKHP